MTKKSNIPPLEVQVGKNWAAATDGINERKLDGQGDIFNEEFARNPGQHYSFEF